MECSKPGAIRDEELFAYLEGESVRPAVQQHLAACQYCSTQAKTYSQLERKLITKLYRWDCPPNGVLGDYQFGLLSPQQAVEVGSHLNGCMLCRADVAQLNEFLANDRVLMPQSQAATHATTQATVNAVRPVQDVKRALEGLRDTSYSGVRRILATLVPQQPRTAMQRGAQLAAWPRRYHAEDVSVSIQIERGTAAKDTLQVIGFVTRKGTTLEALDGTPVKLIQQTSTATREEAESIDDLGNFVFPAVVAGTYTMEIHFKEGIVVIDQLPIEIQ